MGKRGCPGVAIGLIADGKQRVFAFGRPSMKSERAIDGSVRLEGTVQGSLPDTVSRRY